MLKKKLLFAIAPLCLMVATVNADDNDLKFDLASISDASIEVEDVGLDGLDVDQLGAQADGENGDDAIEACFRRFGYRHGCYSRWYRPCYSYNYGCYSSYPSFYCYRPIYRYAVAPIYNYYWGCY